MNQVQREEKKFLISVAEYLRKSCELEKILMQDPHNGSDGYLIRSLYFDTLYDYSRDAMNQMNFSTAVNSSQSPSFNFASYAETFKMIDDAGGRSILIIYNDDEEERELIEQLKYSGKAIKRRLQKYMVSVKEYEYKELEKQRVITDIEGIACLANENYYNRETGILFDDDSNYIYG